MALPGDMLSMQVVDMDVQVRLGISEDGSGKSPHCHLLQGLHQAVSCKRPCATPWSDQQVDSHRPALKMT